MVIFVDVDGTLVDYEGNIPQSAKDAIRKVRALGHKVYICTGRSKAEIYQDIWDIGLDGMIGGNGSYVESNGHVVIHEVLSILDCKAIEDWCHDHHLEFYVESNNGLFASEHFEVKGDLTMKAYAASKHMAHASEMTVRKAFPNMIFNGELVRDDVNKISFILNDYSDYEKAKLAFPHLTVSTWGGKGEHALFADVGIGEIDKAKSIATLLVYLGESCDNTMAIGDAKIDIPMLNYCEIGIAMGNGGQEVKAVADYITTDINDNGLYNAFVHYGLID